MPSTHMCINAYTYKFLCVQWHHYIHFFANIYIKLDKHARQIPSSIIWWEILYIIYRPQNERVPLILQLASYCFGFSIPHNPYIRNLLLSTGSEDYHDFLSHICYTIIACFLLSRLFYSLTAWLVFVGQFRNATIISPRNRDVEKCYCRELKGATNYIHISKKVVKVDSKVVFIMCNGLLYKW